MTNTQPLDKTTRPLKVAVMGAGAVGCYYGGMLARAGHDVTLIARPLHVAAIAQNGLRLQTAAFDEQVRLAASSEASAQTSSNKNNARFMVITQLPVWCPFFSFPRWGKAGMGARRWPGKRRSIRRRPWQ